VVGKREEEKLGLFVFCCVCGWDSFLALFEVQNRLERDVSCGESSTI
jgi:hypothetical protein